MELRTWVSRSTVVREIRSDLFLFRIARAVYLDRFGACMDHLGGDLNKYIHFWKDIHNFLK